MSQEALIKYIRKHYKTAELFAEGTKGAKGKLGLIDVLDRAPAGVKKEADAILGKHQQDVAKAVKELGSLAYAEPAAPSGIRGKKGEGQGDVPSRDSATGEATSTEDAEGTPPQGTRGGRRRNSGATAGKGTRIVGKGNKPTGEGDTTPPSEPADDPLAPKTFNAGYPAAAEAATAGAGGFPTDPRYSGDTGRPAAPTFQLDATTDNLRGASPFATPQDALAGAGRDAQDVSEVEPSPPPPPPNVDDLFPFTADTGVVLPPSSPFVYGGTTQLDQMPQRGGDVITTAYEDLRNQNPFLFLNTDTPRKQSSSLIGYLRGLFGGGGNAASAPPMPGMPNGADATGVGGAPSALSGPSSADMNALLSAEGSFAPPLGLDRVVFAGDAFAPRSQPSASEPTPAPPVSAPARPVSSGPSSADADALLAAESAMASPSGVQPLAGLTDTDTASAPAPVQQKSTGKEEKQGARNHGWKFNPASRLNDLTRSVAGVNALPAEKWLDVAANNSPWLGPSIYYGGKYIYNALQPQNGPATHGEDTSDEAIRRQEERIQAARGQLRSLQPRSASGRGQ